MQTTFRDDGGVVRGARGPQFLAEVWANLGKGFFQQALLRKQIWCVRMGTMMTLSRISLGVWSESQTVE